MEQKFLQTMEFDFVIISSPLGGQQHRTTFKKKIGESRVPEMSE